MIEFRNVTVMRGERIALESVDLSIGARENVAILGPNGSGKSSLVKTITRECYPLLRDGASVRILGRDCWDVSDLRKLLGIVSNDLIGACTRDDFSGREIVLSGFFSSIGLWPYHEVTSAMQDRADEVLDLLEATRLADRSVCEMSSGEVRRLVIGRALVHRPLALILDEPTNSLDVRAVHELRQTLSKLAASGAGIIVVTHHLADIIPETTRAILLKDGRIYADGPKERVLSEGPLTELFGMPVELLRRDGYYHLW